MAGRSVLGWGTVSEYDVDPIVSDSDDGRKTRQTENRALTKRKTKKSLPFAFPVRDHQAISFGSTVSITASRLRVNEISTSDFHRTILLRTATFDACNGPVAQMPYRRHVFLLWRKRALAQISSELQIHKLK